MRPKVVDIRTVQREETTGTLSPLKFPQTTTKFVKSPMVRAQTPSVGGKAEINIVASKNEKIKSILESIDPAKLDKGKATKNRDIYNRGELDTYHQPIEGNWS